MARRQLSFHQNSFGCKDEYRHDRENDCKDETWRPPLKRGQLKARLVRSVIEAFAPVDSNKGRKA